MKLDGIVRGMMVVIMFVNLFIIHVLTGSKINPETGETIQKLLQLRKYN